MEKTVVQPPPGSIPAPVLAFLKGRYWWLLPVLFSLAVYANSLKGVFFWDDRGIILENTAIKTWSGSLASFLPEYWNTHSRGTAGQYRPLRNLFFTLDYSFWRTNPFGYHLTNYLLNALAVFLVAVLAMRVFGSPRAALLAGLLFAMHPAHSENINYVKNRSDILCLIFLIYGFLCWLDGKNLRGSVMHVLALLSKEFAVMLPLVMAAYALLRPGGAREAARSPGVFIMRLAPYLSLSAIFAVWKFAAVKPPAVPVQDYVLTGVPAIKVVLSTLVGYVSLLFAPVSMQIDRTLDLLGSPLDPRALAFVAAAAAGIWLISRLRGRAMYFFALAWILLFLLPVLNIIPLKGRAFAEQRLFVVSTGWALLLGGLLAELSERGAYFARGVAAVVALAALALGFRIAERNLLWRDEVALWGQAMKDNPNNLRAVDNLAAGLFRKSEYARSEYLYNKLLVEWPDNGGALTNMGIMSQVKGDLGASLSFFEKALAARPGMAENYCNLGSVRLMRGEKDLARQYYAKALELDPLSVPAQVNLGIIYAGEKNFGKAAALFKRAAELDPDLVEARLNLASAYKDLGMEYEAGEQLRQAQELMRRGAGRNNYNPGVSFK